MLDLLFTNPLVFVISCVGLLFSLTVHEFAHAWVADKLGDPTPRAAGRVTLNPLAHLDPLGTMALLFFRFGWGKPVPFNPDNLVHPVQGGALIALAGPGMNLLIAIILSLTLKLSFIPSPFLAAAFGQVLLLNIILAVFNLVPVYPLDGSKIILAVLPPKLAYDYEIFMQQYGMFILIALIFPWYQGLSPIAALISPIINLVAQWLL